MNTTDGPPMGELTQDGESVAAIPVPDKVIHVTFPDDPTLLGKGNTVRLDLDATCADYLAGKTCLLVPVDMEEGKEL